MNLELKRNICIGCGVLSLVIGIIGIPLPLLPTTPFLILAAYFFSKGSDRFHSWLINHKVFGSPINDWRRNQAIALRAKVASTVVMAISFAGVAWYDAVPIPAKAGYALILLPVLIFIWTRNSR